MYINFYILKETYVKSKKPFLAIMSRRQPSYIQLIVHKLYVDVFKKSTSELRYIIVKILNILVTFII